jgi:multiple sugar transport system permease protein
MTLSIRRVGRSWRHYAMLLPFFLFFLVFFAYPIAQGFSMSLQHWRPNAPVNWVGAANYLEIIRSPRFIKSLTNILLYVFITVPVGITVAFALAVLVNNFKGFWSSFFRSAYFIPSMIPIFLAATVWRWMLAPDYGTVNIVLGWLGIPSINWLREPRFMIPALVMVDVWRSVGFNMVILLAGLKGISEVYYDAAKVDGATVLQQVRHITVPLLEPILFLVVVNGFISAMQVFDAPWIMTDSTYAQGYGGVNQGLLFPVMEMMGRAFGTANFSQASAIGFILLVIILLITLVQFIMRRRTSEEY